ncbi:MarR family winged helix-turn-helix transcriptional regulator [Paenibacillus glycanilyticus]|uniref:MarR family transcriptional regulator n=1 Tax=Paenibacillus glycanilyticus TaxID=126569 RepID=A0ABQ6GJ03_9BACL|nr:MarR family winged helix-turn-helix transcriptional regulator [Paenibacillus glycanilyticus]GLX70813.1 MarR family transcriptional regulator [Paenibacillus glycanilyticus]
MQETETMHFIMLNSKIFRNTQIYLDRIIKEYELSSGSLPYLLFLDKNEGISQNKLSEEIGNDKAMSARTISKLIQLDYLYKEQHEKNSRAYRLYLTEKAKQILPVIHEKVQGMVGLFTEDLTEEDLLITMKSLKKIYDSTQKLR